MYALYGTKQSIVLEETSTSDKILYYISLINIDFFHVKEEHEHML